VQKAGGDVEKAKVILRKYSAAAAEKKGDRVLGAGTIGIYLHSNNQIGAMVELSCETDFVSKNEEFVALARDIAMHVSASSPQYLRMEEISEADRAKAGEVFAGEAEGKPEEIKAKIIEGKLNSYFAEQVLLDQPFIKNPDMKISDLIKNAVQKFGEKVEVTRFSRFSVLG
jgi:elongation factor Ts